MRKTYHAQLPLTSANPHPRAAELCEMSAVLDANVGILRRVHTDLLRQRKADTQKRGREGHDRRAQVVRAALAEAWVFGSSYEELAFQLGAGFARRFAASADMSPSSAPPKRSALQAIHCVDSSREAWEAMNKALVLDARERKIEDGSRWMRYRHHDRVVESNIHHPLDSSLLFDSGMRVLTRTLDACAREEYGTWPPAITDDARSGRGRRDSSRGARWPSAFRSTRTCSRSRTRPCVRRKKGAGGAHALRGPRLRCHAVSLSAARKTHVVDQAEAAPS